MNAIRFSILARRLPVALFPTGIPVLKVRWSYWATWRIEPIETKHGQWNFSFLGAV